MLGGKNSQYTAVSAFEGQEDRRDTRLQDFTPQELRSPPTAYHHLPQAVNLSWTDPYYDGKHGIIAAFDRNGEKAGRVFLLRFMRSAVMMWIFSAMYWILGILDYKYSPEESIMDDIFGTYFIILGFLFVVLGWRGQQAMLAQHVAVTEEGIRVDNGSMMTVTIPFEHIQNCTVQPHKFCFQTDPDFPIINVTRAAAPLEQLCFVKVKKMEIYGIYRAEEFVALILALKESQTQGSYSAAREDDSRVELQTMAPSTTTTTTNTSLSNGTKPIVETV